MKLLLVFCLGFWAGIVTRDRAWFGLCLPRLGSEYKRRLQIRQFRRRGPNYPLHGATNEH